MDQQTYEGWISTAPKYVLLQNAALAATLDPDYGDERARRMKLYLKRVKEEGLDLSYVQSLLNRMEDDMEETTDYPGFLRRQMEGTLVTLSLRSIQETQYAETKWIVRGILPQGLALLAAPPKAGKSWMALDLCLSAARGEPFLGFPTEKCEVLYLALEDSSRRLKERTDILTAGLPCPDNIRISRETDLLQEGLTHGMEEYLNQNPDTRLIIIDTLQKVRGVRKSNDVYGGDYRDLSMLKAVADRWNIAILVIHHTRKDTESEDPFVTISGSNGLAGTVDTMMVLTKGRKGDPCTLHIRGRDVEDRELSLQFREEDCRWENLGSPQDIERRNIRNDPIFICCEALTENGEWSGTTTDFQKAMENMGLEAPQTNLRGLSVALWKLRDSLADYAGIQLDRTVGKNRIVSYTLRRRNGENG